MRSGEVLAGDEDKLNVVRGDPVEIAAGLYR